MSWTFITWSERKAYRLLSLARNEGLPILRADIPTYLFNGTHPYKSFVGIDCNEKTFDRLVEKMFKTVKE